VLNDRASEIPVVSESARADAHNENNSLGEQNASKGDSGAHEGKEQPDACREAFEEWFTYGKNVFLRTKDAALEAWQAAWIARGREREVDIDAGTRAIFKIDKETAGQASFRQLAEACATAWGLKWK
jgi:hypothetical protein